MSQVKKEAIPTSRSIKWAFMLNRNLIAHLESRGPTKSGAVVEAILEAVKRPKVVAAALEVRLKGKTIASKNDTKVCIYLKGHILESLRTLSTMSQLSLEEVLRLSLEAQMLGL